MSGPTSPHAVHLGVAESGKVAALEGRHRQALTRYREAMRLAAAARAPQLFARHYLYCMLESLERLGEHEAMAELAEQAASAAAGAGDTPFQRRDRAALLERVAVARLKAGSNAAARDALDQALALAGPERMPLARWLAASLARGLTVAPARLAEAQRRHGYWSVRRETVEPARAIHAGSLAEETVDGR